MKTPLVKQIIHITNFDNFCYLCGDKPRSFSEYIHVSYDAKDIKLYPYHLSKISCKRCLELYPLWEINKAGL